MKKLSYWVGIAMLSLIGLVVLVGFLERNGWSGAAYIAYVAIALLLIARGAP